MSHETPTQPGLTDLLARFLNKQARVHTSGLTDPGASAEVTPYEAGPVPHIDTTSAWQEAVAVAPYFQPGADIAKWPTPPHWASLVAAHEPTVALAFCLGNFPQLVRDFHLILQKTNLAGFMPSTGRPVQVPVLVDWARQVAAARQYPHVLLALGSLRLAKNFKQATAFVEANDALIPSEWRASWNNEKAALAWHQGQADSARALWNAMEPNVPVLFNRGMAELFLGNTVKGRAALDEVIATLPESSAWHHLARLYVLLAAR
ncbi:MAG TPA: hypothetical protein VNX28_05075 [Gemmataceae bacterium]|nr:hypothetical protein [Gemmataceae bacterium]